MDRMNEGCEPVRLALGAYVLGALDPEERERVRTHLQGCASCREELAALAVLPQALSRLGPEQAIAADPGAGSEGLLPRITAELVHRRRRLRLRQRLAAGLAVVVAGGGVTAGLLLAGRVATTPTPAAVAHLSGSDPSTGVTATADVYTENWGSSIHLQVSGVPSGDQCELVTVGQSGDQEVAGTWGVGYTGTVNIWGDSGLSPGQLSWLRIETTAGGILVSLPMSATASS